MSNRRTVGQGRDNFFPFERAPKGSGIATWSMGVTAPLRFGLPRGADELNLSGAVTQFAKLQSPEWGARLSPTGQESPQRGHRGVGSLSNPAGAE